MFGILLLNIAAFLLLQLISTVLHEVGHAVAGRILGIRIFSIDIGSGQVVYEFLFVNIRWRFRVIAYGGLIRGTFTTARFFRTRDFFYKAGGPLANALILAGCIYLVPWDEQLNSTPLEGFVPFVSLALVNVLMMLLDLFPRMINSAAGKIPNDGLWLFWKIWRIKQDNIEANLAARYHYETDECYTRKDLVGAQKWIDRGAALFPKDIRLKIAAAHVFYMDKKYPEAMRAYARLVGRNKDNKNLDCLLLNNLAYNCALTGKPDLLPRADTASRLALKHDPSIISYKGTRGSVLVGMGRYDEALDLLHEAMRNSTGRSGRALNACDIGTAESRRGNIPEAKKYFSLARKLDPDCILLGREAGAST
ncbi:MAG TPA: site-2 protease family protein [Candidatus Sulfotelmatobacter sp.]|jgi:tetratricopeptide (TPR) repeat protein|nr:site-2 protease family protein [Candidatus Sulfotelmatobacter sp.]